MRSLEHLTDEELGEGLRDCEDSVEEARIHAPRNVGTMGDQGWRTAAHDALNAYEAKAAARGWERYAR